MWNLWRKASLYHRLPSEIFGEGNPLAAWMLDNCTTVFGTIIENALLERDEVGSDGGKRHVSRYTIAQLLEPDFKLPHPQRSRTAADTEELRRPVEGMFYDEV